MHCFGHQKDDDGCAVLLTGSYPMAQRLTNLAPVICAAGARAFRANFKQPGESAPTLRDLTGAGAGGGGPYFANEEARIASGADWGLHDPTAADGMPESCGAAERMRVSLPSLEHVGQLMESLLLKFLGLQPRM